MIIHNETRKACCLLPLSADNSISSHYCWRHNRATITLRLGPDSSLSAFDANHAIVQDQPIIFTQGNRMIQTANQRAGCDYYTHGVVLQGINPLLGRNQKTFLFKISKYFSTNIHMADLSVQFYVYRNQNIRGIVLDKAYHYRSVLVRGV